MKTDVVGKFGSFVNKQRGPIEMVLVVLILINFAPTEVFGTQVDQNIKSALGPFLNPIQSIMNNVFVRLFLWLILLWSCCYTKDLQLFTLIAIYFVVAA